MSSPSVNYRTFVVANPAAAAGAVRDQWPLIERLLKANLPEFDYAFTEGPGHATLLTREALRADWEMVVSIGGDGTLNEVLNGFFSPSEPTEHFRRANGWISATDSSPDPINEDAVLGHLPMGTGGDFRRSLGLMGGLAETVQHLRGRRTRTIDIGQLGYIDHQGQLASRYFINIAAAGISGLVDHHVNNSWKGLGGTASFVWGTFRAFLQWHNTELEVRLDGTTEIRDRILNLVAANGEYFGAGMWIAPGAEVDDGEFQVVIMGDMTKPQMVRVMPNLYSGNHLSFDEITRHRAREVAARPVDTDRDILLDMDGEQPGRLPATWRLHEGGVKFKV